MPIQSTLKLPEVPPEEQEELDQQPEAEPANGSVDKQHLVDLIDDHNLARSMHADTLSHLGMLVCREYEIDENSRAKWKEETDRALKFATQQSEPKQYPWPKACLSLDTDILTDAGWKPIAEVAVGERVMSRDPAGHAIYAPVTQTFRHRATEVVHFHGKSIDLLATPNHRMLVEDRHTGETSFIEARNFVTSSKKTPFAERLASKSIPLTSANFMGLMPEKIYGIPARAYARFLGWYISEGSCNRPSGSFAIAQSRKANAAKYKILAEDIAACGFTSTAYDWGFTVHARSMPELLKAELRGLGTSEMKHLPAHAMNLHHSLLSQVLETLILGDGNVRLRSHQKSAVRVYHTTSRLLADQVQIVAQLLGQRGTITSRASVLGGVIGGRTVGTGFDLYCVSINQKRAIQVLKLKRELQPYDQDVACVEVQPFHTIYVRRNGKAVWVGNSNVIYPLITTAAIQFWAKAYPAIIPGQNIVKGMVWGDDDGTPATQGGDPTGAPLMDGQGQPVWLQKPGSKRQRADRVGEHMSFQLLEEIPEWQPETSVGLMQMSVTGGMARKTYRDHVQKKTVSRLVPLVNLVWNRDAPSFEAAPRQTELVSLYPHQVREMELADETFLPMIYGTEADEDGENDANDTSAPRLYLEQHRRYDLDGDGYPEPIIVTVHKQSSRVVRVVVRYEEDGIEETDDGAIKAVKPEDYYTLYTFCPDPEGGSYPMGWGRLMKPMNEAVNTTLNQMFDAGHLANTGSGLIGSGLSMHAGPMNFQIGQFKPVNNKGGSIRDNVYQFQWPGPNAVLFQLLGFLVTAAKEMASTQDILTDPGMATAAPTTMLALIQTGERVYTAIYKNVYNALKSEFAKIYRLNRLHIREDQRYRVADTMKMIRPEDYRLGGGVEPIADPRMVTDMQKLGRAAVVLQFKDDPLFNPLEVRRRYLEGANIERIDELLVKQMPAPQPSPEMIKAQVAQQEAQVSMATAQSKLGLERAQELQAYTQALVNFRKAQSSLNADQVAFMEQQLNLMRLRIEALNTTVKAASVDATVHGHNVTAGGHVLAHHAHMTDTAQRAREIANEPVEPGESPPSGGPGLPAVAPPPGNGSVPGLPEGPGGGGPPNALAALGGPQPGQ